MKTSLNFNHIDKILRQSNVDVAYLFGSHATGTQTRDSDIDIAVLLPEKTTPKKRFETRLHLMELLEKQLGKAIDLIIINDIKSLFFKYVIVKEGKVIYLKSEERRIDFECRTLSLYFDFQPFLELYNKNYVKNNL